MGGVTSQTSASSQGARAVLGALSAARNEPQVSTTQRSYIKTPTRIVTDAMKQLESTIACATLVQQVSVN
jgi:hypothetical protein